MRNSLMEISDTVVPWSWIQSSQVEIQKFGIENYGGILLIISMRKHDFQNKIPLLELI
jgi:hypothetical protein